MSLLGDIFGFIDSGRAASAIGNAGIAAEHGVLGATSNAQQGISDILNTDRNALQKTGGQVVSADTKLNSPFLQAGNEGLSNLEKYAGSPASHFSFNLNDYFNSPAYQFQLAQGNNAIQNGLAATGRGASGQTLKDLTTFGQGLASTFYNSAFQNAQNTFQTNQNATLANNSTLIGAGELGANRQQGANQIPLTVQDILAQQGLQGTEFSGALGLQGATTAGNLAVGAGQARAGGILGQGNALAGIGGDVLGMLSGGIGSIPLPGGGATTLQGILGG